eukprot:7389-Eustigmatos_ZCMA.PRE.1
MEKRHKGPKMVTNDRDGCLADVLVYQIWFRGGYLATFPVSGFSRFNLLQPTMGGCDPTKYVTLEQPHAQ